MDLYSSEGSDSDSIRFEVGFNEVDYSYRGIDNTAMQRNIQQWEDENQTDKKPMIIQRLRLNHNYLEELPTNIGIFHNLRHLDVANNRLKSLPEFVTHLPLVTLNLKNNLFTNHSLPKSFETWASTLDKLNIAGNNFSSFPFQLLDLINLTCLYVGDNAIEDIPNDIFRLRKLLVLSVGGNHLASLPGGIGALERLQVLIVNDNRLESLPSTIANLKSLRTLQLHKNRLRVLPTEIIKLECLTELSLRDNPLVVKFVNDMMYSPASLLEMSARVINVTGIRYSEDELPQELRRYLSTAHYCVNPKCNGVYFDNRVEHIKFVDFCGKYRVPLLQYLCSSRCVDDRSLQPDQPDRMRKVLLG